MFFSTPLILVLLVILPVLLWTYPGDCSPPGGLSFSDLSFVNR